MLIPPRPMPPFLPLYDEADHPRILAQHSAADREWQRHASIAMWTSAVPVVCVTVAGAVAAWFGPSIVLNAFMILGN
jgi:fatty acid desaturase